MRGLSQAAALLSSVYVSASIVPRSTLPESASLPDYVIDYGEYLVLSPKPIENLSSSRLSQMSLQLPSSSGCLSLLPLELWFLFVIHDTSRPVSAKLALAR